MLSISLMKVFLRLFLTGRNMAFKKNVTSSVVENNYTAANAVDGVVANNTWDNCFVTPVSTETDWIIIDLGHQTFVSSVKIISFNTCNYGLLYKNYFHETQHCLYERRYDPKYNPTELHF